MGDRRIVVLEFSEPYGADLAVYTHWGGSGAENAVAEITSSQEFKARVGDETYAARIFIDQFTKDARDSETGYGVFPVVKGTDPTRFAEDEYGAPLRVRMFP